MLKAMRALTRYAAGIEGTGFGDSDFRVLEVLLHKGPLPVNTIGSIREHLRQARADCHPQFARQKLIASAFRKHAGQMRRVFSELSPEELSGLELALKKVGKRTAPLMEQS